MSDRSEPAKAASRIIRERAMAILRDTRARIDPVLLAAMKERLSAVMPNPPPSAEPPAAPQPATFKEGLFKRDYKTEEAPAKSASAPQMDSNMEPVDKQKIAQIVLEYMKNREDKQKH